MNREEIDTALGNCETYEYGNATGYKVETIDDLIDKIYDDFENRTCESCKHNNTCEMQYVLRQGVTNTSFLKDFGCNKWESVK